MFPNVSVPASVAATLPVTKCNAGTRVLHAKSHPHKDEEQVSGRKPRIVDAFGNSGSASLSAQFFLEL